MSKRRMLVWPRITPELVRQLVYTPLLLIITFRSLAMKREFVQTSKGL